MLTVFCGGVHGVGKTSLCRALATRIDAEHVSAGALLRSVGLSQVGEHLVESVARNQEYLLDALRDWRQQNVGKRILLDGHFCLVEPIQRIVPIPVSVFAAVRADALVLLLDEPDEIATRIVARDQRILDETFIRAFQQREIEHAEFVSKTLDLPLKHAQRKDALSVFADWLKHVQVEH